jgi:hypothetical protein
MFTAGILRVASRLFLLMMAGVAFLGLIAEEGSTFLYVVAGIFFILAIFTAIKAKEQGIKAKVQIEEKERARIQAKQR